MKSQQVTANDIARGQIRIPRESKVMFPEEAGTLDFVLRGQRLSGKWNPGLGPDRERSGVLRVPKATLESLVAAAEVLQIVSTESGLDFH